MTGQRGFTLIETLIAFAILAVTLTALFQTAGTSLRGIDTAAEQGRAVLAAQSQLDRILALKRMPELKTGTVSNSPFTWQLEEISSTKLPANLESLTSARPVFIRLTVRWNTPRGGKAVSIERLIFVPRSGA